MRTPSPTSANRTGVGDECPKSSGAGGPKRRDSSSGEETCSICLEKIENRSHTDQCVHLFCFTCILEWSKVKNQCPQCRKSFTAIKHTIQSDTEYRTHTLPERPVAPRPRGDIEVLDEVMGPAAQAAAMGIAAFGRQLMAETVQQLVNIQHYHLPIIPPVHQELRNRAERRRNASTGFRRSVYDRAQYVMPESVADVTGRYRESSPEWYRENQAQTHRLVPWLNRELNALMPGSVQTPFVLQRVLDLIERHPINGPDFRMAMEIYLDTRTAHFQHEFFNFARSVYDMVGYDGAAQYGPPPHPPPQQPINLLQQELPGLPEDPRLTIGSRARREVPPDRRTVETLDLSSEEEPNQGYSLPNPALPPFPDPVSASSQAGPSTSSAGGASGASKYPKIQPYYSLADIQISDDDDRYSADGIEVVEEVKPKKPKTPEIIDIPSSPERGDGAGNDTNAGGERPSGGGVKDGPDDWAPYRGRLSPILKKSKKRRDPLGSRAPSSPSSDESEDEGQKPSTSSTKVKLHFKPLKRAKQLISRLNAERRELRNSRDSDGSTSAEEREREVSKRAIEAEMGIKMPEWEWKASKKGKGKGKGKGKKSSLQEPSTSKPPTSTDLKTTQEQKVERVNRSTDSDGEQVRGSKKAATSASLPLADDELPVKKRRRHLHNEGFYFESPMSMEKPKEHKTKKVKAGRSTKSPTNELERGDSVQKPKSDQIVDKMMSRLAREASKKTSKLNSDSESEKEEAAKTKKRKGSSVPGRSKSVDLDRDKSPSKLKKNKKSKRSKKSSSSKKRKISSDDEEDDRKRKKTKRSKSKEKNKKFLEMSYLNTSSDESKTSRQSDTSPPKRSSVAAVEASHRGKVAQKLDKKFVTPSTDESGDEFRGWPLVKSQVVKPQTKSGHGASDSGSETSPSTSKAAPKDRKPDLPLWRPYGASGGKRLLPERRISTIVESSDKESSTSSIEDRPLKKSKNSTEKTAVKKAVEASKSEKDSASSSRRIVRIDQDDRTVMLEEDEERPLSAKKKKKKKTKEVGSAVAPKATQAIGSSDEDLRLTLNRKRKAATSSVD